MANITNVPIYNKAILSTAQIPSIDADYGPYEGFTIQEALTAVTNNSSLLLKKCAGKTVGIKVNGVVTEYWYQPDGQGGLELVEKQVAAQEETDPTVPAWAKAETKPSYTANEVGAIPATDKGANGGVATLDNAGKVPQSQLPSYVDDVIEGYLYEGSFYTDSSHTESITGEGGKIYVDLTSNKSYRWSGSQYTEISGGGVVIGNTTGTAFDGGRGQDIEDKIPSDASTANKLVTAADLADKADLVPYPTDGNFVAMDANGNLINSLKSVSSFLTNPNGINGQILKKSTVHSEGVYWDDAPSNGEDGKSAYELWCDENSLDPDDPSTPSIQDWLASLKAELGGFKFVEFDQSANTALSTYGDHYSSAIGSISQISPSSSMLNIVLLMNDDGGSPTKTKMICTEEAGNNSYQFVYIGDVQTFLTNTTLADNLTTDDSTKALTAKQGVVLNRKNILLDAEKLSIAPGKNLFDYSATVKTKLDDSGVETSNTQYRTTPFILVEPSQAYTMSISGSASSSFYNGTRFCFYNEDKTHLAGTSVAVGQTNKKTVTTPSSCRYMKVCIYKTTDNVQLEEGSDKTTYEPYNITYKYTHQLEENINNRVVADYGHNLFDKNSLTTGFLNASGGIQSNYSNFRVSDYIPVIPGETYHLSAKGDTYIENVSGSSNVYHAYYDSLKGFVSSITTATAGKSVTIPSDIYYMRLSVTASKEEIMVEKGSTRSEYYEEFSPIAGHVPIIKNKQVKLRHLDDELVDKINSGSAFKYLHGSDTLTTSSMDDRCLILSKCHINKNTLLVGRIKGTISEEVWIGVGLYKSNPLAFNYGCSYLAITPQDVKLYKRLHEGSGPTLVDTFTFSDDNFELTTDITIEVDSRQENNTITNIMRIHNGKGDVFEKTLSLWWCGTPFIRNGNTTEGSLDVELSYYIRDLQSKIWIFGDSYVDCITNIRWPYYICSRNMNKFLVDSYPGESASARDINAFSDLNTLLSLGARPTYIVWCLGMNGDSDTGTSGNYTIATSQQQDIGNIIAICNDYNIIPILTTIPTVPGLGTSGSPLRQRTGFSNYVRSLGKRYIDFADAVNAQEDGTWTTGLLELSDGVHPTAKGAKVLASRVLLDFPEISTVI